METILKFLGTTAAVYLTVTLVPGVEVAAEPTGSVWLTTLLVALVWSVITLVIRPVLTLLTLPVTLVTFGLFAFVLNALLFWAMTLVVPGFFVSGFWVALLGAVVLSFLNWLIQKAL